MVIYLLYNTIFTYNFKLHFRYLLYPGYLHIASRGRRYRRYPWYRRADTYATRLLYPNARPVHILSFGAHRIRSYERVPAVRGPGRIRPGCRRRIRLVSCFSNFWMFDEVLDVKSYFDDLTRQQNMVVQHTGDYEWRHRGPSGSDKKRFAYFFICRIFKFQMRLAHRFLVTLLTPSQSSKNVTVGCA